MFYFQKPRLHFNPRTHEECDSYKPSLQYFAYISIHALTRSATRQNVILPLSCGISIHALTRSATGQDFFRKRHAYISIHALTRSATSMNNLKRIPFLISIHALTRSATPTMLYRHSCISLFQSTHSRGVRRVIANLTKLKKHFNPRTHEECDIDDGDYTRADIEFQSTHSRGVRRYSKTKEEIEC